MALPSFQLNTGTLMPVIGFGTGTKWYKRNGQGPLNQDLIQVLQAAISSGFTHFDTAETYGTEEEVGIVIKESNIPREEFLVTTKVLDSVGDIDSVINNSLRKLQLGYVDLYMIHSSYWTDDISELQDTWKKMEAVYSSGRVRAIGVSNYLRPRMDATLAVANIVPAVNQIEFHPYLQQADDYIPWLQNKGIQVSGFKPLTPTTAAVGGPLDAVVERISKRHGVLGESILLRWEVQGNVIPIRTTERESRLIKYLEASQYEHT